jgi:hypothetical protein
VPETPANTPTPPAQRDDAVFWFAEMVAGRKTHDAARSVAATRQLRRLGYSVLCVRPAKRERGVG